MTSESRRLALSLAATLAAFAAAPCALAQPQGALVSAIEQGRLILEARPRYERAEQDGFAAADALTLRTRLGWETATWNGLQALIEVEDVRALSGDYNDGIPPAEPHATISDPEGTEFNRAQLAWTLNPHVKATFGRQRIAFDDDRFVGPGSWRQDEQSFDAVRADITHGRFTATYAYVDRVNRVLAESADWQGPAHLLNGAFAFNDALKLTGFAYVLDFDGPTPALAQASSTLGLRATGATTLSGARLEYAASLANQRDHGDNPASFDLDYRAAQLTATHGIVSGRLSYESLEGNGARGFSTPLASLHPFQGWADVFTTTPANGIVDLNLGVTLRPRFETPYLSNPAITLRRHEFETERTNADLGQEWDFQATAAINRRVSLLIKHAAYDGPAGGPADVTRSWIGLEFKL